MNPPRIGSRRWRRTAGVVAVILVALSWAGVAVAMLFFELSKGQLLIAVAAAALVTEVTLYVGAVILGLTFLQRARARLRFWSSSRE